MIVITRMMILMLRRTMLCTWGRSHLKLKSHVSPEVREVDALRKEPERALRDAHNFPNAARFVTSVVLGVIVEDQ